MGRSEDGRLIADCIPAQSVLRRDGWAVMTALISADGLTKTFGAHRGVSDLRFEVRSGEVYGFLGPNGAGKSTTIRLLLGLYRPTAGAVSVFGQDPVQRRAWPSANGSATCPGSWRCTSA